jgi:glycosyltransferase involved in cell wall biosynthesis
VISRLAVGGPAIQAITLTSALESRGYRTTLIRGREEPDEGSLDELAQRLSVQPVRVGALRRNFGPHDVLALPALMAALRRERPALVHTHLAKAGALGRLAAMVARPGAIRIHTFHGHSLSGYFSARRNRALVTVERLLARRTHCLVAVSAQVRDELVRLGVAPVERFEVVPLGLDLSSFSVPDAERHGRRASLRRELGIGPAATVVTLVARLVAIKRVDRFLRVAARLADQRELRFLVVGDGELRDELRANPAARALGDRLVWGGLRRDMADVYFASDVVALSSDNEGTPVALIEARAAGLPVAAMNVGGVAAVVDGESAGRLSAPGDESGLRDAIASILDDLPVATAAARQAQGEVAERFSLDALTGRLDDLYRRLLGG